MRHRLVLFLSLFLFKALSLASVGLIYVIQLILILPDFHLNEVNHLLAYLLLSFYFFINRGVQSFLAAVSFVYEGFKNTE